MKFFDLGGLPVPAVALFFFPLAGGGAFLALAGGGAFLAEEEATGLLGDLLGEVLLGEKNVEFYYI